MVVEKDDSSLTAQKMTVLYEKEEKAMVVKKGKIIASESEKTSIKRIEAKENVKIFSEEFVASGDSGFYDPKQNIFVLEKNVIVNNGTSIASGDKFIYDLRTKKGHFVGKNNESSIAGNGGDRRVVVVIGDDLKEQKSLGKKSKKENE